MTDNRKSINILGNVTIKNSDGNNQSRYTNIYDRGLISAHSSSSDEENQSNHNFSERKRRYTSSYILFEEEPYFSDPEEEREYGKTCYLENVKWETSQNLENNCSLNSDELKVIEIMKQYADINTDNITEDFKQLISLSRQIIAKYSKCSLGNKKLIVDGTSTPANNKNSCLMNSADLSTLWNTEKEFDQDKIVPSKSGFNEFSSEKFNFHSELANISLVTSTTDNGINAMKRRAQKKKGVNKISKKRAKMFYQTKEIERKVRGNLFPITGPEEGVIKKYKKQPKNSTNDLCNKENRTSQKRSRSARKLSVSANSNDLVNNEYYSRPLTSTKTKKLARNWMKQEKILDSTDIENIEGQRNLVPP